MRHTLAATATLLASVTPALAQDVAPKVVVITMFGGEAAPWVEHLDGAEVIAVPGLSPEYPEVRCTADLCMMTTDMGFANAASSVSALVHDNRFDLSRAYFGSVANSDRGRAFRWATASGLKSFSSTSR